jgi:hypothetical protein
MIFVHIRHAEKSDNIGGWFGFGEGDGVGDGFGVGLGVD